MAFLLMRSFRLGVSSFGGYHAEGWHPTLSALLVGPTPAGARLEWRVVRLDGSEWFTSRASVAELGADATVVIELRPEAHDGDLDIDGAIGFTLRLVSELDGVDELLHDGSARVIALPGEHRFAVDHERMLPFGFVTLDTLDEPDAPRLWATVVVAGDAESWHFEAHVFHDGRRIARADSIETRYAVTANDGTIVARELDLRFDEVRGWNNLRASGWGGDRHLLDANDGRYEVKLLRDGALVCVTGFDVARGRLVETGLRDEDVTLDEVYAFRTEPEPEPAPDAGDGADAGGAVDALALRAFFDRAERLLLTWEDRKSVV